jgi:hypothetical protein
VGNVKGAPPSEVINGGAGICTYSVAVSKLARTRAFLGKLLMGATFDAFIDSTALPPSAPKSTTFVEALWRRREPVPAASARADPATAAAILPSSLESARDLHKHQNKSPPRCHRTARHAR